MEWIELGKLADIQTGKLNANAASENGKYPFFTCAEKISYIDKYAYDKECILVAGNGDLNVKYYDGKFNAYQRTYIIESKNKEKLNSMFLFYFMNTYMQKLRDLSIGGVIKYIKLGHLTEAKIPVPPMNIQKQIVEVLDEAQSLIDKRKEQIKLLDDLIESIFYDMFGDPIKNDKGWEVTKLADISKYIGRGRTPKYLEQSNCCVINQACIYWDVIKYENIKYVSGENFKLELENGDLLVTSTGTGTLGRANIFYSLDNSKYTIDSHVTLVRLNKRKLNERYLKCFLKDYNIQRRLYLKCVTGSTNQIELSSRDFKNFDILFPPIQLQNQFAEKVEQIESQKQLLEKSLKLLEENYNSLMQKAFKGELFT